MREDSKRLTDMVFHGCHGTLQAEHELGQPFVVSIKLRLDLRPAGTSDDLTESVDYGKVRYMARVMVEGSPVQLTETLAERIAAATLDEHPEVEAAKVRAAEPHVRLDGTILASSTVEMLRRPEARP